MALPCAQRVEVRDEQVQLERVGVVVVDALALLERPVGLRAVVVILLDEDADAGRQRLEHGAGDGRLAGAGAAGDAEDERAGHDGPLYHALHVACRTPCVARASRASSASSRSRVRRSAP